MKKFLKKNFRHSFIAASAFKKENKKLRTFLPDAFHFNNQKIFLTEDYRV